MEISVKTPERQFERLIDERANAKGRILGISHPTLRLFAHDRAGRLSLRVILPVGHTLKPISATIGIEVDTDTREGDDPELAFVSRNPSMDPLFLSFVRYSVERTLDAETEKEAVQKLIGAYYTFMEFMEREKSLGPEALKGLYAELVVMLWLMDQGVDPSSAIMGWKGPYGENKDFVLPDGSAFEVKSAPLNAGQVRISSIDQLEPNGLLLTLCLVHLEKAQEGVPHAQPLGALIDQISDRLTEAGADAGLLTVALEHYGLGPSDKENRDVWFVAREPLQYTVLDSFPRISGSEVPSGVSRVSYDISIEAMGPFQTKDDD